MPSILPSSLRLATELPFCELMTMMLLICGACCLPSCLWNTGFLLSMKMQCPLVIPADSMSVPRAQDLAILRPVGASPMLVTEYGLTPGKEVGG